MSEQAGEAQKQQRQLKNFLLQPSFQLQLGFLSVVVGVSFSILIISLVYINLGNFYQMILELTELREEVTIILNEYLTSMAWWVGLLVILYTFLNLLISIYYTHRMIGPSVAFKRHIQALKEGDFDSRVKLRTHDAFLDVAQELNELAEKLAHDRKSK